MKSYKNFVDVSPKTGKRYGKPQANQGIGANKGHDD